MDRRFFSFRYFWPTLLLIAGYLVVFGSAWLNLFSFPLRMNTLGIVALILWGITIRVAPLHALFGLEGNFSWGGPGKIISDAG